MKGTKVIRHEALRAPLSEQRYQALLRKAGAFFAEAEIDPVAQRSAAIDEIREQMDRYEISIQDLFS